MTEKRLLGGNKIDMEPAGSPASHSIPSQLGSSDSAAPDRTFSKVDPEDGDFPTGRPTGLDRSPEIDRGYRAYLTKLDAFATRDVPFRFNGGLITLMVWLATIGYLSWAIWLFVTRPLVVSTKTDWTLGNGPFPMSITCHAMSGCYVSNRLNPAGTARVTPNETQQGCMFLAYNDSMQIDFVASILSNDGLVVLYEPNTTNPDLPPGGFGYTINSQVACDWNPNIPCDEGVKIRPFPIGQGLNLVSYVLTKNYTAMANGRERNEYFALPVDSQASEVDPLKTPCVEEDLSPDMVLSKVLIMPSFVIYEIKRENNWVYIIGETGGAYELFFLVGALVLTGLAGERGILMNIMAAFSGVGGS